MIQVIEPRIGQPTQVITLAETGVEQDEQAVILHRFFIITAVESCAGTLQQIKRCAPGAIAATKRIMLQVGAVDRDRLLDEAAGLFAEAARGPEGMEGMMAFVQKRKPNWADE